eukprot:TRINITY_DN67260_c0_g1_i1.p1 TRINITY_DN67260_c0_g1~~TRINITY_DN67260_c0_g1_i1.p1  ORF type:complete len:407 (-),score=67.27 TRINITY_DN67260_c0_g1_i1:43-1263(-)
MRRSLLFPWFVCPVASLHSTPEIAVGGLVLENTSSSALRSGIDRWPDGDMHSALLTSEQPCHANNLGSFVENFALETGPKRTLNKTRVAAKAAKKHFKGAGVNCPLICDPKAKKKRDEADKVLQKAEKKRLDALNMLNNARLYSCLGWSPAQGKLSGKGSSCAKWGYSIKWCFVDAKYKGVSHEFIKPAKEYPGKFYAPCATGSGIKAKITVAASKLKKAANEVLEALKLFAQADVIDKKCIRSNLQKAAKMTKDAKVLLKQAEEARTEAEAVIKEARLKGCSGWKPKGGPLEGRGYSCKKWGYTTTWCWVADDYKGLAKEFQKPTSSYKGKFYAPCDIENEKKLAAMRKNAEEMKVKSIALKRKANGWKKEAKLMKKKVKEEEQSQEACILKYPKPKNVQPITKL